MLHRARAHTPLPRLQSSASSSHHRITLHPSLGWLAWSDSPAQGELASSPKPFQNESTLGEAAAPRSLPAAPALPVRLTPAWSSFPKRAPRGRRPPPSGGCWVGSLLPRAAAAVAAVRSGLGSPRAARGPARSRPGDAGQGRGPTAPPA